MHFMQIGFAKCIAYIKVPSPSHVSSLPKGSEIKFVIYNDYTTKVNTFFTFVKEKFQEERF